MRSPFRALHDWSQVRRIKTTLREAILRTPPPSGVMVPDDDVLRVRAAIELCNEYPNLFRKVVFSGQLCLMRVQDVMGAMRVDEFDRQKRAGFIVGPEDRAREEEDFALRLKGEKFTDRGVITEREKKRYGI